MTGTSPDLDPLSQTPRRLATALGVYALLGGAISLAGWLLDLPRLTDWNGSGISIPPNTALAVIGSGAALILLARRRVRGLAALLGALVALLGATALVQYVAPIRLEAVNQWLLFDRPWGQAGVVEPGRMGPPGGISSVLIGIALVLASLSPSSRGRRAVVPLALTTVAIATLSITGYLFGASLLYSLPYLTIIAFQTATFIVAIAAGTMAIVPERAPASWLLDRGATGAVARRAIPVIIVLPFLFGWLRLSGETLGLYDARFGVSVFVLLLIALLLALLAWDLRTITGSEAAQRRSERRMAETLEEAASDVRSLARLQALSTQLVQAQDLDVLLREILSASADLTGTSKGNIQFYDPVTQRLRIVVHQGLGPEFVAFFAEQGWDAGCEEAARARTRLILEDLTQRADLAGPARDVLLRDGIRAFQSTPLVSRNGRLLGMLNNHFTRPGRPTEKQLRYLDLLARMAADLIERSQTEQSLRDADRRKDEFLAMLAHELRNPLAPIRNAVEILRRSDGDESTVRATSDMLERQVDQMVRLVDDLLDVSRVTRGKIEIRKTRVDLASVVSFAVEASRGAMQEADHTLTVDEPAEPVFVDADSARLAQVVGNLLNNAHKFMPRGGNVRVSIAREGGAAVLRVRDTGIGIAPDQLARIFDLFVQLDTALDRSVGGLGIGLTLVKSLVELHGGSVEANSDGLGRGSEFVVRLPVAIGDVVAMPEPAPVPSPAVDGRRILVVDDNEDGARSLAELLRLTGHDTHTAHDGLAAVEAAERLRPDVVVLDIGLPRLDGYGVGRRIRGEAWGRDILLVALTGWGQEDDRRRSREAGFDVHLVKPLSRESLDRLLARLGSAGERPESEEAESANP